MGKGNVTTTVSTKGRVSLPKAIWERLHWDAGTRLVVERVANGLLLRPVTSLFAPTRPEDVFGCLPYPGKPKSIEEMAAAIAEAVKRRHARGRY